MDKMASVKEPQVSIGLGYVNSANTSFPKGGGGCGVWGKTRDVCVTNVSKPRPRQGQNLLVPLSCLRLNKRWHCSLEEPFAVYSDRICGISPNP